MYIHLQCGQTSSSNPGNGLCTCMVEPDYQTNACLYARHFSTPQTICTVGLPYKIAGMD